MFHLFLDKGLDCLLFTIFADQVLSLSNVCSMSKIEVNWVEKDDDYGKTRFFFCVTICLSPSIKNQMEQVNNGLFDEGQFRCSLCT